MRRSEKPGPVDTASTWPGFRGAAVVKVDGKYRLFPRGFRGIIVVDICARKEPLVRVE